MIRHAYPPDSPPPPQFRSWGEAQIARLLNRYSIPYLYEHPVAVLDQGRARLWYPDFQLRDCGLLIEYCGRPDDPAYAAGMAKKQRVYHANGLTALMLTREDLRGDWPNRVLGRVEGILAERLESFRQARYMETDAEHRQALPGLR